MRSTVLVLMLAISLSLAIAQDVSDLGKSEATGVVKSQLSRSAEESLVPTSGDRLL